MVGYEVKDCVYKAMNFKSFLFLFLFVFGINFATAEIIDNQKVTNKEFGSWIVSCKEDVMLGENSCKLFTNILDGSILFVTPNNTENKIVIISKEILNGDKIIFRVDKNNLIESELATDNRYNIVEMSVENKGQLLEQMKTGDNLYARLNIRDDSGKNGMKQITARFNLADFSKALIYYNSMAKSL